MMLCSSYKSIIVLIIFDSLLNLLLNFGGLVESDTITTQGITWNPEIA